MTCFVDACRLVNAACKCRSCQVDRFSYVAAECQLVIGSCAALGSTFNADYVCAKCACTKRDCCGAVGGDVVFGCAGLQAAERDVCVVFSKVADFSVGRAERITCIVVARSLVNAAFKRCFIQVNRLSQVALREGVVCSLDRNRVAACCRRDGCRLKRDRLAANVDREVIYICGCQAAEFDGVLTRLCVVVNLGVVK